MKKLYAYKEVIHYLRKVVLFLIAILCISTFKTFAEGTKQLAPSSSDRLYLALCFDRYGDFGRYNGTPEQRLYIHIENPGTEKVYFGFSQFVTNGHYPNNGGKTDVYIRIKNPNGDIVWPNANNAAGFKIEDGNINSWEEASSGPKQLVGSDGYNAMMFDPSGLPKGDYYIEFSKSESVYNDDEIFTEWWDISVVDSQAGSKLKEGRVWSKNWAFQSPGYKHYRNGKNTFDSFVRPFNGKVYSYCTEDNFSGGYVTEVDFKNSGFRGAAFNLAFNWSGASATDDFAINRKSVLEENRLSPEFPIFLNNPDPEIYVSADDFGHFIEEGVDGLPKLFGCSDTGYYFRVAVDKKGRIEMILDFNNNGKFDPDLGELVITQLFKPNPNESSPLIRDIYWDGKDANGDDVDPSQVHVMFNYIQGTFHFPMYDVEFLTNGIVPKTVRPEAPKALTESGVFKDYIPKLYWDDRDITGNLMNGQAKVELTGDLAPSHAWNTYNYDTDFGYGNRNSINTYWHSYNSTIDKICALEEPEHTCELFVPKSISGTVFEDTNRDGIMDSGEEPLMGAKVRLYWDKSYNQEIDADDEIIEEFTTKDLESLGYNGDLGNFIFEPQIGRQYLVEVSSDPNAITGVNPRSYTVYSLGVEYYDQNFGVAPLTELSLSVSKSIIQENEESLEIIVDLNYQTLVPVTINLIYSGTAEGIDYNLTPGLNATNSTSIEIPVGGSRGVIELSSIKDVLNEEDETIEVSISSAINAIENGEQSAIVTIIDGNHAIANLIDNDADANSISENVEADAFVHIIALATDVDGDNITYSLVDNAGGRFKIDETTGVVSVDNTDLIDFEIDESHVIRIKAKSSDESTVEENFTIVITDIDGTEGDTDHDIANLIDNDPVANSISENVLTNALVHITALATDADDDNITYSLVDNAGGRFKINASTGVVLVADASLIDFEINKSHIISIKAKSSDESTIEENFTIVITNVDGTEGDTDHDITDLIDNDPAENSIGELDVNGSVTHLTALATDADGDDITYHLLDDATGRFKIIEGTGVVKIADASLIDYETNTSHTIKIEARSTDGSKISGDFIIRVTDENEYIQAIDDFAMGNEDIVLSGENLLNNDIKVKGRSLEIDTKPVSNVKKGELVIHADGTYTYTPDLNYCGVDSFVYSVRDNGVKGQSDQATVTITINSVNDQPLAMNDEAEVYEDEILNGLSVLDNDSDVDSEELSVNPLPVTDVEYGSLDLNSDGTYTYIPDADFYGEDKFTYEVCDNETSSVCEQATVTISVLAVNDTPRAFDFEMEVEEASLNNPINIESPYDPDGEELSVKILSTVEFGEVVLASGLILNDNDVISVGDLLSLEFNAREAYVGNLTMVYEVSDEGGLSTLGRVKIIVLPIDVFIPNAITPNNDSLNDKFKIVGLEKFPENSIEIFNRWGNIVYKKRSYDNKWDGYGNVSGQISNDRLPPGTYFYVFKFGMNKQPLTGYVYMTY